MFKYPTPPHFGRRKKWQPTPVFLPGKSHGQRSLGGYSSWGRKESDMTAYWDAYTAQLRRGAKQEMSMTRYETWKVVTYTVSLLHTNKFHSKSMCVNAIFLLNPAKVAEVPN